MNTQIAVQALCILFFGCLAYGIRRANCNLVNNVKKNSHEITLSKNILTVWSKVYLITFWVLIISLVLNILFLIEAVVG